MNTSIVIALPKIEDAKKIRTVLNRYGFTVAAVCNSGANALASISELDGGVLLCGYHLQDMYYRDLLDYMPDYFDSNGSKFMVLTITQRLGRSDYYTFAGMNA